jgi:hypothetical protein
MLRLQRGSGLGESALCAAVARWLGLNYVRLLLTLAGWLVALRALATS